MAQTSRISDYEQRGSQEPQGAQQWAQEMVHAQPLASLCAVFAAGFVLGVGIVSSIPAPPPRQNARRSLNRMGHQLEGLSDRIAEAVTNSLPKQLTSLWHHH